MHTVGRNRETLLINIKYSFQDLKCKKNITETGHLYELTQSFSLLTNIYQEPAVWTSLNSRAITVNKRSFCSPKSGDRK